jgi:mannose-6-phosphate isomerase-like protein (cupin superfamily)
MKGDISMKNYVDSIEKATASNNYLRKVVFTGKHGQLVLMTLQAGEEIGEETHPDTDQFFRIEEGKARFVLDDEKHTVGEGGGVMVRAGTRHNVINVSDTEPLKLYTLYTRPEHPDGMIQKTMADAITDEEKAKKKKVKA